MSCLRMSLCEGTDRALTPLNELRCEHLSHFLAHLILGGMRIDSRRAIKLRKVSWFPCKVPWHFVPLLNADLACESTLEWLIRT
ncbi:hypothetical protein EMEDMD4_750023 [Sinorhizobium medicae]|uniref:Uncharacterized protein n=1 Tax=Sinorhizobium medicae TaxID=110321 RepID=A0A508XA78_9HYPH|nr:hypothetical protein EMEDMD4_750023 [Sinorhizobium medicae]